MASKISQTQEQSVTFKGFTGLNLFSGENFTFSPLLNFFDVLILDEKSLILDEKSVTLLEIKPSQPKKKLKGLFKGLKINEEEIEEAKKSLFPEREF